MALLRSTFTEEDLNLNTPATLSNPYPQAPATLTSSSGYGGVGINPFLSGEGVLNSNLYNIPDPVRSATQADRDLGRALYEQDTSVFGLAASFYGPMTRAAQSVSLRDLYPNGSFSSFSGTAFDGGDINVLLDPDLANKQAEFGTVHWYRKVAQDLKPSNVFADAYTASYFDGRDAPLMRAPSYAQFSEGVSLSNTGRLNAVTYSVKPTDIGWNKPNQNLFNQQYYGGGAVETYGRYDRLAPTSVSQGRGLFTGPQYSIKTNTMNLRANAQGYVTHSPKSFNSNSSGWINVGSTISKYSPPTRSLYSSGWINVR